ncbi:DUF4145 domain-containing protein [Brevundimonas sp.]|uniref:DUF4145 domain-containing protein n=1 Tax=Brevundimonas sp. TaxID=1871086 RepID=UPI0025BD946D|nr:DUF4145 domain-containing protein [Brevundimonas sp.]
MSFSKAIPSSIRKVLPALAEDVARRRNPVGSLNLCRSILEAALRELEVDGDLGGNTPIIKRIESLRTRGLITATVAEWAHEIRLDGNRSTHELVGDPQLALAYYEFLRLFLEVAFDLPAKIKAVKAHKTRKSKPIPGRTGGF